jgi:hypothetical protein
MKGIGALRAAGRALEGKPALPAPFDPVEAQRTLDAFLRLVGANPEYGWRAGKALGPAAFVLPKERPDPMPQKGIVSIEASYGDRPSKAKRVRTDQARARFSVKLQVCTTSSRGVSDPSFTANALFYDPHTALAKADELSKPTKCKTPFTQDYLDMIAQVVETVARPNGMMIGFLYSKPRDQGGTYYHDRQVILASAKGLAAHRLDHSVILLGDDKGQVQIDLPETKPAKTYAMQSTGVIRDDLYSTNWATGMIRVTRK